MLQDFRRIPKIYPVNLIPLLTNEIYNAYFGIKFEVQKLDFQRKFSLSRIYRIRGRTSGSSTTSNFSIWYRTIPCPLRHMCAVENLTTSRARRAVGGNEIKVKNARRKRQSSDMGSRLACLHAHSLHGHPWPRLSRVGRSEEDPPWPLLGWQTHLDRRFVLPSWPHIAARPLCIGMRFLFKWESIRISRRTEQNDASKSFLLPDTNQRFLHNSAPHPNS